MKIYVCHSSAFDYKKELYQPIRDSELNSKHQFIFPHEKSEQTFASRNVIPTCNLIICEASYPSISVGIEVGWANKDGKRIIFIYQQNSKISRSLNTVSSEFIEYKNRADLIKKLREIL